MPFRRPLCFAAAIIASTVAGCMAVSVVLAPTPVTLATGTPGGIYHPVGNAICRMFNLEGEHQAMPCVAVSSDGSVANIRRVESGDSTFGLSQTDVAYAAFHGEGPFAAAGPDPKLRTLIALYPEAFTVVARADTGVRLVTYADDLVILCRRGNAEAALHHLREIMGKLKLTVNEDKTRICRVPEGEFDFLRFTFRQMFSLFENGECLRSTGLPRDSRRRSRPREAHQNSRDAAKELGGQRRRGPGSIPR